MTCVGRAVGQKSVGWGGVVESELCTRLRSRESQQALKVLLLWVDPTPMLRCQCLATIDDTSLQSR